MLALITRAAAEAENSAARLRARGIECLISPLLRIVDVAASIPPGPFDAIVLTSAQAARTRAAAGLSAELRALPLWIVGAKTLAAARAAGLSGAALAAEDAAALLRKIAGAKARRALYLAGVDRKPVLEQGLAAIGVELAVCIVYAAEPQPTLCDEARAALRDGRVFAVLHYSRRSAELYAQAAFAAGVALDAARHVCLSEDVAAALRERGAANIVVAAEPNERALIDALAGISG